MSTLATRSCKCNCLLWLAAVKNTPSYLASHGRSDAPLHCNPFAGPIMQDFHFSLVPKPRSVVVQECIVWQLAWLPLWGKVNQVQTILSGATVQSKLAPVCYSSCSLTVSQYRQIVALGLLMAHTGWSVVPDHVHGTFDTTHLGECIFELAFYPGAHNVGAFASSINKRVT